MSENNPVFVDANVFLRVFVPEDTRQTEQSQQFIRAVENKAITAVTLPVVVAEVQWVAKSVYDISRVQRVDMLERLVEIDGLSIENFSNVGSVLALYRAHDLKLVDSMISSYALAEDIPIVSYDTDFDTLGCERLEPGEVQG